MGEHSPGPWMWTVVDGEDQLVDAEGNYVIEANGFMCGAEDAALIRAAPTLLALLKRHWHASTCRCDDCTDKRRLLTRLGDPGDGRRG